MWKVVLQGLLAHKLRLALTALAIVLGVTFISGTFVLTDTLHNTFTTLFGHVYQNVDFEVRGKAAPRRQQRGHRCDPQADPPVDRDHGAASPASSTPTGSSPATPSSSHPTARPSATGAPRPSAVLRPRRQLSALHLSEGTAPTGARRGDGRRTAQKYHFAVGDRVRVLLAGPPRPSPSAGSSRSARPTTWPGPPSPPSTCPPPSASSARSGTLRRHRRLDKLRAPTRRACSTPSPPPCPGGRGGHRPDGGERAGQRHQPGPVLLLHRPAGLRLHLPVRRGLHHLQHLLHHRGPAHPGAGAAAHRRGQPAPGVPLRAGRGAHRRDGGLAGRPGAGRAGRSGPRGPLKGFGITLPSGALVFEGPHGHRRPGRGVGVTVVSAISPARRAVRIPPVAALADLPRPTSRSRPGADRDRLAHRRGRRRSPSWPG
jgi:putative ABC transport system permease protein